MAMALSKDHGGIAKFMSLYSMYKSSEGSLLPVDGGVLDQAATFVEALKIADSEYGQWYEKKMSAK